MRQRQNRQRLVLGVFGLTALLLFAGFSLLWITKSKQKTDQILNQTIATNSSGVTTSSTTLTGKYLVSGDVFWGRGIDSFAKQSPLKYDWPFSRLSEFHPEKYNGWISDMECPVTTKSVPYQVQVDSLIFSCSPDYLPSAAKWFSAMTIANNHTDNTGTDGFSDTQTNLYKAGIQAFGDWDLGQINDLCEVVSLKVNVGTQTKKLPIAMCGYHWLARQPTDQELAQITKYAAYFPVWVFPHGGTEYAIHSTPAQEVLYRKMIDAGADVVFGDHPHVVENTEAYKGKLIVYDMGNLIFDQWFDNEVTRNMIVDVRISAKVDANLRKYIAMADSCTAFKDSCLQTAQKAELKAYKLSYTYDIIAGDSSRASLNDRLKHLGSPTVQDWLKVRANWPSTLAGLKAGT